MKKELALQSAQDLTEPAADVAVGILMLIAEDPLIRPSQRMKARRYLRRLEQGAAG